jgi:predicted nuclease of predicted toxin-antitoxin system
VKILLDSCVWHGVRDELAAAGHDVVWTGDWPEDPGDAAILSQAHAESRVLVTLDKDFGALVFVRRMPHSGIVRLVDIIVEKQPELCLLALDVYGRDLEIGAIVTVEPNRVRLRRPSR